LLSGTPLQTNGSANFNFSVTPCNQFGKTGHCQDANGNQTATLVYFPLGITGTPDTTLQPTLTCDPRSNLSSDQWINGSCFGVPTQAGVNGAYQFPYLKGPMYQNHDLAVFKNLQISESKKLQVRLSAFNFLNHPLKTATTQNVTLQFQQNPDGSFTQSSNTFGHYTDNKFGRRIMELAVKFYF
jgi:hypothetical protein